MPVRKRRSRVETIAPASPPICRKRTAQCCSRCRRPWSVSPGRRRRRRRASGRHARAIAEAAASGAAARVVDDAPPLGGARQYSSETTRTSAEVITPIARRPPARDGTARQTYRARCRAEVQLQLRPSRGRKLALSRVKIRPGQSEPEPPLHRVVRAAREDQQTRAYPALPHQRIDTGRIDLDLRHADAGPQRGAGADGALRQGAVERRAIDDGREGRGRRVRDRHP